MTNAPMSWIRRLLVAGGVGIAAVGVAGLLRDNGSELPHYLRYVIVGWLASDLLVLPLAIVVGFVTARWLPGWARPVVQGALLISAAVTVVAFPLVLGRGRGADIPSALPRDYGRGVLITLAGVWIVAAALAAVRLLRQRRRNRPPDPTTAA
jgi:hypothetical protein